MSQPRTFPSLPLEIRLQIYTHMLPRPRILTFYHDYYRRRPRHQLYSQNPQPVLLFISRETRAFLLSQNKGEGGYIFIKVIGTHVAFHPELDWVRLARPWMMRRRPMELTDQNGGLVKIKRLVLDEGLLHTFFVRWGPGERLRRWLLSQVEELCVLSYGEIKFVEGKGWEGSIYVDDLMGKLEKEKEEGGSVPKLKFGGPDDWNVKDAFCRELVRGDWDPSSLGEDGMWMRGLNWNGRLQATSPLPSQSSTLSN